MRVPLYHEPHWLLEYDYGVGSDTITLTYRFPPDIPQTDLPELIIEHLTVRFDRVISEVSNISYKMVGESFTVDLPAGGLSS